jgi:hypothetical protein
MYKLRIVSAALTIKALLTYIIKNQNIRYHLGNFKISPIVNAKRLMLSALSAVKNTQIFMAFPGIF